MTDIEREYDYKVKWGPLLFVMGYFAFGAVGCGYAAWWYASSDMAWPRDFRLEFPDRAANLSLLYWVISGLCVLPLARHGAEAVCRLLLRHRVAFTPRGLILPKSMWSSQEVTIAYEAITALRASKWFSAQRLCVTHTGGKRRVIAGPFLPSKAAFDEVCELLKARAPAAVFTDARPHSGLRERRQS